MNYSYPELGYNYNCVPMKIDLGKVSGDSVFIAIDSSRHYLAKDQKQIADQSLNGKPRDLNE